MLRKPRKLTINCFIPLAYRDDGIKAALVRIYSGDGTLVTIKREEFFLMFGFRPKIGFHKCTFTAEIIQKNVNAWM